LGLHLTCCSCLLYANFFSENIRLSATSGLSGFIFPVTKLANPRKY
jgi:hypothetical protein